MPPPTPKSLGVSIFSSFDVTVACPLVRTLSCRNSPLWKHTWTNPSFWLQQSHREHMFPSSECFLAWKERKKAPD